MVSREIGVAITTAVNRVRREMGEVVYSDVASGPAERVGLRVTALDMPSARTLYLVALQREPAAAGGDRTAVRSRIADLEDELLDSRQNLQASMEQLETTNEELHASNEELISSNEELQSTIEELQSVNEELYALNVEHRDKIAELLERNADVDNLLSSTDVGTMLIDASLDVRRFNAAITEWVSLLPLDVGRPLRYVRHSLLHVDLLVDAGRVLASGQRIVRDVRSETGRWVLLRLVPYKRNERGDPQGVVVTTVDVSALAHAQAELQAVLDALPAPAVVLDGAGAMRWVSRGWPSVSEEAPTIGESYQAACGRALAADPEHARAAEEGVLRVLRGEAPRFVGRMRCGKEPNLQWVDIEALPVEGTISAVLVLHRTVEETSG
jgi:two-component system CheB/CheR fusion protein